MELIATTIREPIYTFILLLAIIFLVPPIFEKLKLPGLVGLLVAGVIFGSSGLGFLNSKSETMTLLADIGKIYLMFVAGLEIDLEQFRRTRNRSLGFGFATFAVPLIAGILVGRIFGFSWNTSVLIGSLLASHTLLAYPIVKRLGVVNDEAVTVTIGATIFTDIGALLVLAICLGVSQGDFTPLDLGRLLGSLAIYTLVVLFGLDRLGRDFFRRSRNDQGNQFLFVLLALFIASVGAQLIGVEKIVGAFLAGLAVNDAIGDGPVKEKVEFVGSVLFIPIFFVDMGLLLDIKAFEDIFRSIAIPLSILGALMASKFIAACLAKLAYRYSWQQAITMWSLSLPQVAATLAAALIGFQAQIINERVFNSVILLMLVTSVLGPLITSRSAARLNSQVSAESTPKSNLNLEPKQQFRVVVPVYNPQTERYLLELASLLTKQNRGEIVPLAIAQAKARLDSPQLDLDVKRCQQLLAQAEQVTRELNITSRPELRIEYDVAQGISHASREVDANSIILGFNNLTSSFRSLFFGSITDSVLWSAHCSVIVARLLDSPLKIRRILVPVESFNPIGLHPVSFTHIFVTNKDLEINLLHVCPSGTSKERKTSLHGQLETVARNFLPGATVDIRVTADNDFVRTILHASSTHDLVILRSQRQRVGVDSLALGATTKPLLQNLNCSIILLGEL